MNPLEQQTSPTGAEILSREGRWLCSPRDPVREAKEWLRRQKIHEGDRTVIIMGAGATYHITELLQTFPNISISAIELDAATLNSAKAKFPISAIQFLTEAEALALPCDGYDVVLNFRPAWAGQENQYMALYFRLTQNSPSSLARAAEENKLPLTSQALNRKATNIDFSLKDLDFVSSDSGVDEVKFWRTLRELVD